MPKIETRIKLRLMHDATAKVWVTDLRHPSGPLLVAYLADGTLIASTFIRQRSKTSIIKGWQQRWPRLQWQNGKAPKTANTHTGAPIGTPFQQMVWKITANIPTGSVLTYGDIARAIGKPRAARAVGSALGANPLVPFVPCHRVVGSNGGLGGYSGEGGLNTKRALLKRENVSVAR
jgi:methylated-DNA-[protein]-cysteine S-methyltransferase